MEYLPLFLATIVLATTVCGGLSTTPDTSCVLANVTKNLILQRSVVTNRVNTSEVSLYIRKLCTVAKEWKQRTHRDQFLSLISTNNRFKMYYRPLVIVGSLKITIGILY